MNLQDVHAIRVPRTACKRLGRGWGSGTGKTSGRGEKGAGRRSGTKFRMRFEGGQMALYRRLPKKGFSNAAFRVEYHGVNVGELERWCEAGSSVDLETLRASHLVPKSARWLKILGEGTLTKALHVSAHAASEGARAKIEASKGTLALTPTERAQARAKARTKRDERAVAREKARTEKAAAAKAAPKPGPAEKGEKKPKAPKGEGAPKGGGAPPGERAKGEKKAPQVGEGPREKKGGGPPREKKPGEGPGPQGGPKG